MIEFERWLDTFLVFCGCGKLDQSELRRTKWDDNRLHRNNFYQINDYMGYIDMTDTHNIYAYIRLRELFGDEDD